MAAPTIERERSVGYRTVAVMDGVQGARVPVHVLYPATAPARTERFGPYAVELAREAPVADAAGEPRRVVVFSHGTGSTPWVFRELGADLARAGMVVALIEHPGNSRADNTLAGTPANLANRPRHVRLVLDAVFADPNIGPCLEPETAVVVGHSLGGYTALAVAGGRPMALPEETAERVAQPVPVEPDPRVRALVLLAPALPWFMGPGALAEVHAPMLVRTGEHDEHAPPEFVERILRGLPAGTHVNHAVVPGANHFAFLGPFPAALAGPGFPPSQDRPGFDRAAYQPQLLADILGFLRATPSD